MVMTVHDLRPMKGHCVKLYYKGYEISISEPAYEVAVYADATSSKQLFVAQGTTGEAVRECMNMIDTQG